MKIMLHGATCYSNFGDVLYADIIASYIKDISKDWQIYFYNQGRYGASRHFQIALGNDYIYEKIRASECDSLVYIPGGYFGTRTGKVKEAREFFSRFFSIGLKFMSLRKPILIIGVGGSPIRRPLLRSTAKRIMKSARCVTVRDKLTKDYWSRCGVKSIHDYGDLLSTIKDFSHRFVINEECENSIKKYSKKHYKIIFLNYFHDIERMVLPALNNWLAKNPNTLVIVGWENDAPKTEAVNNVIKKINCETIYHQYTDHWHLCGLLNRVDAVITTKLHVSLVGAALDKAVICFAEHYDKTIRFYQQIDKEQNCVDLTKQSIDSGLKHIEKCIEKPISIPDSYIKTANKHFSELRAELLNIAKKEAKQPIADLSFNKIQDELLISIVMPVYNESKNLRATLESIFNQTYKNWEIICVDDGSTDDSMKILKEFAEQNSRLKILRQKNQGAAVARNAGLNIAEGEYILFLDADDLFMLNLVEEVAKKARAYPADIIVYNRATIYDQDGFKTDAYLCLKDHEKAGIFNVKTNPESIFSFGNVAWNKAFRRAFLHEKKLSFDKGLRRAQDALFTNSAMVLADTISVLDQVLVYYRIGDNNSWLTINKYPTSGVDFLKKLHAFLVEKQLDEKLKQPFTNLALSDINFSLVRIAPFPREFARIYQIVQQITKEWELDKHPKSYYSNPSLCELAQKIATFDNAMEMLSAIYAHTAQYNMDCEQAIRSQTARIEHLETEVSKLQTELDSFLSIKNTTRRLLGNIKRKIGF